MSTSLIFFASLLFSCCQCDFKLFACFRLFVLILFRLFVVRGKPAEVFPRLFKDWSVTRLTFEADIEPYAMERDKIVCQLADQHGVEVKKCVSNTLYDTHR